MRQIKIIMLLIAMCVQNNSWAQKIQVGDLYYSLSGETASVVSYNHNNESLYNNDEYHIPETIIYNNYSYTVSRISSCAFSSFNFGLGIGSKATKIEISNSVTAIGPLAFGNCKNLTSMIIPQYVTDMNYDMTDAYVGQEKYNAFYGCNLLRVLVYLPKTAPRGWTATTKTYVPNKQSYSLPTYTMNDSKVIEMITFDKTEFEYTGQAPTTTWTNNVEGYTASLSISALSGEVGSHEEWIPVTFTKGDESFTANVVYRYTIKPAKLTAKVNNASREYGEDNPQFDITYSGFQNGENESVLTAIPNITTSANKTSNVGEYPITINGGSATNYEFVYEPGLLTVTKAPLSAKVNDTTKVYGARNPEFTIDYYGLKNEETSPAWTTKPTFQTDATQNSGVGQYEVKAINGDPVNYDLGEITAGILSIMPASLTIKANDAVRLYYSDEPNFGYRCNGFINGEDESVLDTKPLLSTTATRESSVGTYEIKVSEASSPNYSISFVNGTLTITPRMLMASVGNYERQYNEENPAFEIKYDGFMGDDYENVLITKPVAKTSATKTSDVGTYKIDVTGGSADNYTFNYISGTLTINKAEQTISWEQDLTELKVGDQVELKAIASSGLPITYTMDKTSVAEIYSAGSKYYLDCKNDGTFQIVAVQEGSNNYYSSARNRKTVVIENPSAINDFAHTPVMIQRTPTGIRVTDAIMGDVIRVYTIDGLLQNTVKVNDKIIDISLKKDNIYIIKVGDKTVKLGNR